MVDLADAAVQSRSLKEILPRHISPRRRQGILEAIEKGLAAGNLPAVLRSQPYRQNESEKRKMQEFERLRDRRAAELDIDPTLIASRAMLVLLAKDWNKHQQELMKWQRELLTP